MTTGFAESSDWSSRLLAHLRGLIMTTEPEITEEIKWRKPSNPLGVGLEPQWPDMHRRNLRR